MLRELCSCFKYNKKIKITQTKLIRKLWVLSNKYKYNKKIIFYYKLSKIILTIPSIIPAIFIKESVSLKI